MHASGKTLFPGTARAIALGLVLVSTALSSPSCQRKAATGGGAAASDTAAAAGGCYETNPRPGIALACQACLKANAVDGPGNDGCCSIKDPVGKKLCEAVSMCMRAGGPPVGSCNIGGDTTTCYCGAHQGGCDLPGTANGPCMAQITAAAARNIETGSTDGSTPTPEQILSRYGDAKYALGPATNIASIAGALCKMQCETGM